MSSLPKKPMRGGVSHQIQGFWRIGEVWQYFNPSQPTSLNRDNVPNHGKPTHSEAHLSHNLVSLILCLPYSKLRSTSPKRFLKEQATDDEDEEGSLSEEPATKESPKRAWHSWPQGIPPVDNAQPMMREEMEELEEEPKTPPIQFGWEPDVPAENLTLANDIEDESEAPPKEAQELAQPIMKEELEERTDTPVSKEQPSSSWWGWGSKKPENVDVQVEKSTLANDIEDESEAPPKEAQELAQPIMKEELEERTDTPVSKEQPSSSWWGWGSKKPENVDVPVEKSTLANDIEDESEAPPKEAQELAQPIMKEELEERTDTPVSKEQPSSSWWGWGSKKPENVDVQVEKSTLANDIEDESEAPPKEAQELAQPIMKEELEERTDTPVSKEQPSSSWWGWGSKKPENVDVQVEKSTLANDIEDESEAPPKEAQELAQPIMKEELEERTDTPVSKEQPSSSWWGWGSKKPENVDVPVEKSTLANDIEDDSETFPQETDDEDEEGSLSEEPATKESPKRAWYSWPQGIQPVDNAQPMMREEMEELEEEPKTPPMQFGWEPDVQAENIEDESEAPPTEQKQSWFSWPYGNPTVDNAKPTMEEPKEPQKVDVQERGCEEVSVMKFEYTARLVG